MKRYSSLKRKTPLRRVSKVKSKKDRIYSKIRKEFLAEPGHAFCPVMAAIFDLWVRADQIHHLRGRAGSNYLDRNTFMAVSLQGHKWIHDNPSEAKRRGWMMSRY